MTKNFNIKGTVQFAGKSNEGKFTTNLKLTDERAKELVAKLELDNLTYEGTPIKETEEGNLLFKATSKYPVKIYDNDVETEDISLEDIGEDSEVILFVGIGVTTYKRKEYQVAYLKAVNIIKFIEAERFNAFAKDSDVEEI